MAVNQLAWSADLLVALDQIALDHDAENARFAVGQLAADVFADEQLAAVVLLAVGVAHIDHHPGADAGLLQEAAGVVDGGAVVVGLAAAATQDDVAVLVAGGLKDGGMAEFGDRQEDVRVLR